MTFTTKELKVVFHSRGVRSLIRKGLTFTVFNDKRKLEVDLGARLMHKSIYEKYYAPPKPAKVDKPKPAPEQKPKPEKEED